jgi:hypothetical protein
MSTEKTITTEHKANVLKSLSRISKFNGKIGLIAILGLPTAFITWIWTDFTIFFKIIATSIILMLFNAFVEKIIKNVKKGVEDLEVSD